MGIGMKKNIAHVLVFLAYTPEATSRAIECGTDLRQPEVSQAMKNLKEHGWVTSHTDSPGNKGRPKKIFVLAKSLHIDHGLHREREEERCQKTAGPRRENTGSCPIT
jgi:predicted transcriptional regulator